MATVGTTAVRRDALALRVLDSCTEWLCRLWERGALSGVSVMQRGHSLHALTRVAVPYVGARRSRMVLDVRSAT